MKKIKRLSACLLALMLVIMLLPLHIMANTGPTVTAGVAKNKTKVMIHKILMPKTELEKMEGSKPKWPKDHDGKKINDITTYFGTGAKAINGVAFRVYEVYTGTESNPTGYTKGSELKTNHKLATTDLEDTKFYKLIKFNNNGAVSTNGDAKEFVLSATNGSDQGVAAVTLPDGTYRVVEDKFNSTYKGEAGETLTDMKAVPFDLVLPAGLPDGSGNYSETTPLHVYPKNTEDKVKFDKNFAKTNGLEAITDTDNLLKVGAAFDNYQKAKANAKAHIGKEIPYEAKAFLPKGSVFNNLHLEDTMDRGLEYKTDSLTVTTSVTTLTLTKDTDYTITNVGNGFKIEFTEDGLKKINKQAESTDVEITFSYKAKVTAEAIDDKPMDNYITIRYNHKPPTPPSSIKPKKTKIKVKKEWANAGNPPAGVKVKYLLLDENDKVLADVTFKSSDQVDDTNLGHGITFKVKQGETYSGEFEGLDDNKYYKVKEIVNGYEPKYTNNDGTGEVKIENTKNPTTITPTPPQVTTGGKKFVKTDKDGTNRLAGAEFIIQNKNTSDNTNNDKFLKITDTNTNGYTEAENKYKEAIAKVNEALAKGEISAQNKVMIDNQEYNDKTTALNKINELKKARDEAFVKAKLSYTWTDQKDQATKFYSDGDGRFFVTGLEYGNYQAVETKAPVGYALPSNGGSFTFTVSKDSHTQDCDIAYEKTENGGTTNNAKKIINNKVSIPQTGGMGTLLFTIVGIALMGGAGFAMLTKKRREEQA